MDTKNYLIVDSVEKLEEAIALLEEELVTARAEHLSATEKWHEGQAEQDRTRHQIETGKENIARLTGEIENALKKQRDLQVHVAVTQ